MKKFSILLIFFITTIAFNACSTDDDVTYVAEPSGSIAFTSSVNSEYDLREADNDEVMETFSWNTVDYGVATNENYRLEVSLTEDFDNPVGLASTMGDNANVTVQQLIDATEDAELDEENGIDVYFRVVAYIGTADGLAQYSETQETRILLPSNMEFRNFFLVGNATAAGWNENNNNPPLFRDAEDPNIYYFTGWFEAGEFKLLETLGSWQPQWGLENGELASSDDLDGDPGSFIVDTEGYYTFEINAEEMTYSFEEYDAAGAQTYNTIGLVGDATPAGWDADTPMTQIEFDEHIWYANSIELTAGDWKLRANSAWDVNWGGGSGLSGQAEKGGDNIPAESGIFDIWFNDLTGRYLLIPVEE